MENSESSLIKEIELAHNEDEIISALNKLTLITHNSSDKITQMISINELELKSSIFNNTETIIKMFNNTKDIKEDFHKSKRGFDSLTSQMLM